MSGTSDLFLASALDVVPRALGFCDRDPDSATYGCCDRTYWHYKLIDVANARFQEAALLFALAYATPAEGNVFFGQAKLLGWIRGAWRFWLNRRNRDGSTSELYPSERCFCSTAFTAAAFAETVYLLGGHAAWKEELRLAAPTFRWLAREAAAETANQMAASLQALTAYASATELPEFRDLAAVRSRELLALERADGVFPEYGGFDSGYQSITLSCLARTESYEPGDMARTEAARRAASALSSRIDDKGRVDVSANSRGTQFLYPYGLACQKNGRSDLLASALRAKSALQPSWMDDRYCVPLAIDYLFAARFLGSC